MALAFRAGLEQSQSSCKNGGSVVLKAGRGVQRARGRVLSGARAGWARHGSGAGAGGRGRARVRVRPGPGNRRQGIRSRFPGSGGLLEWPGSAHGCLTALWPLLRPSGRGFGGVGLKWCPVSRRSGRQLCRNPAGPASDTRRRCLGDAVAGSAREQPKQPLRRGGVPGRGHGRTRAPVAGHYRWT